MGIEGPFLLILIVFAGVVASDDSWSFKRSNFPDGFFFGAATSAYQYEGAWNVSEKGPSNWDNFTQTYPEMIKGNASGKIADDFYYHYKDDLQQMNDTGLNAVRISFSWPRLLPNGTEKNGRVNLDGLWYYRNLTHDAISKGLEPFVTLFHFDIPQLLEEEYGGFLNHRIVDDFKHYANFCFSNFPEVKYWITMNEPWSFSAMGYAYGLFPPGRCSKNDAQNLGSSRNVYRVGRSVSNLWPSGSCPVEGNSGTEPYNVSRNLLLAHAHAVKLYKNKYQLQQVRQKNVTGKIGIVLCVQWMLPYDAQSQNDTDAAYRALDFMYGWFMEPLANGTYPASMVQHVGKRLRPFSSNESELVKGSFDFIGLNYYTAIYVQNANCTTNPSYVTDSCTSTSEKNKTGNQIGPKAGSDWLYVYPQGLADLLLYTKNNYSNPVIYVTENGVDLVNGYDIQDDLMRKNYHNDHLRVLHDVVKMYNDIMPINKVDVRGYFVWSFLDNFEWTEGYTVRFGLFYVNYFNETMARIPKNSAKWFKKCLSE